MKTAFAWIAATALAVAAHGQSAGGSEYSAAQAGQTSASAAQATVVSAELSKKIDTKDAKVGDPVIAKTTSDAHLADGMKLPKGSRLIGHVTDVQAKSRDNSDSHIAFTFDRAVLKDGHEAPIHAVMQSLAAPAAMAASSSNDMMASSSMTPGGGDSMAHGGGSGRASVGGDSGAVPGTATGLADNVTSGAAPNGPGHLGTTGAAVDNTVGLNAGLSGQASGEAMPVGNLSGVTFNNVNASAGLSNSGVSGSTGSSTATLLTGHGRNFSLESGSQMTLSVAPQ